jgi:hypothetical protein
MRFPIVSALAMRSCRVTIQDLDGMALPQDGGQAYNLDVRPHSTSTECTPENLFVSTMAHGEDGHGCPVPLRSPKYAQPQSRRVGVTSS